MFRKKSPQTQAQKTQKKAKPSLYSKIKLACMYYRIPFIIVPFVFGIVIAATALLIGGVLAGWDILSALVSPTACLIYFLLFSAAMIIAYKVIANKMSR